jgi:hypothetical protein
MENQAIGISIIVLLFITISVYCFCSRRAYERNREQMEIIENDWN